MGTSKAKQAQVAARRAKAIQLRLAGMDWQSIADRLDYSDRGAACKDVTRALKKHQAEEADQVALLRHVTVQRLDRLQAAYWPKALQGDIKAAELVRKVIMDRARIEGTEAPTRVSVEAQQLGDEIAALLEQAIGTVDRGT